jgi:branched-chain amino acid transport system ATP-binding protein
MMNRALFVVENLTKNFGAITASNGLNLEVVEGEIHALIGPNGAGKSTAIHQLSGEISPDSGRIFFRGEEITRWSADQRARRGIARTYQITSLFPALSVRDNLAMAVQSRDTHHFRFWRQASKDPTLRKTVDQLLDAHELMDIAEFRVANLAHGQQRQIELALGLALNPKVLLLDEPMAGMSRTESLEMAERIDRLRGSIAVVLVEHDMDVVFRLADRISVLVKGEVICTDLPQAVRANPIVRDAYLGESV